MTKFVARCLFALLFCVFANLEAQGASTVLSNCSQSDVNNAINSASAGDTIVCPAGSWSWSSVDITKNITLQGAGIGSTIISITSAAGLESPSSYRGAFRVTGFTFRSTGNYYYESGMFRVVGGTNMSPGAVKSGWRIDHNQFEIYSNQDSYDGGTGLTIQGHVGGLIDHNRFVNYPGQETGSNYIHVGVAVLGTAQSAGQDCYDWQNLGSQMQTNPDSRAVFIEDNYFEEAKTGTSHGNHAFYQQRGGFVVFRHNEVHNMNVDSHGYEAHHGGREWDINNNKWYGTQYNMMHMRGGSGVIYGNERVSGNFNRGVQLDEPRCGSSQSGNVTSYYAGYGNVDARSNCLNTEGAPCAEGIGRGQQNGSQPLYIWGNDNMPNLANEDSSCIKENRDYYLTSKPGFTEYTYPHPLQSGTEPQPLLVPNPPSGMQIN